MARLLISISILLISAVPSVAATMYPERAYQARWCTDNDGVAEYVLADRTRVDCLTPTHAVEFDFARKRAEAIGQSLYYAKSTGRAPGVVLIVEKRGDMRYLDRFARAADGAGITVWVVTPDDIAGR